MMRTVGTIAVLLGFVAWLVLSYWTEAAAMLPAIAFGPETFALLGALAVGTLFLSAAIQAWLVYATTRSLRQPASPVEAAALSQFRLNIGAEAIWTAAPLLMTVALLAWILVGAGL
jgi:hypothetical protein